MKMPSACALGIFSGRIILIFGIAERLRTLRYPIFTGGVVMSSGICRAGFLRKHSRGGKYPLSLAALASSPKGTPFVAAANFPALPKAVPLGKVAATSGSRRKGYFPGYPLCT